MDASHQLREDFPEYFLELGIIFYVGFELQSHGIKEHLRLLYLHKTIAGVFPFVIWNLLLVGQFIVLRLIREFDITVLFLKRY